MLVTILLRAMSNFTHNTEKSQDMVRTTPRPGGFRGHMTYFSGCGLRADHRQEHLKARNSAQGVRFAAGHEYQVARF